MTDRQVQFAPFHIINDFMVDEYRTAIIREVLGNLEKIPENRKRILEQIKRWVKIPGFRNSSQAPLPLMIKGAMKAFWKNSEFVANILAGWADLHKDLQDQVYSFLQSRDWEILPLETDRTGLPGFMTGWPEDETFDSLTDKYLTYDKGNVDSSDDDIKLMIVWLSTRLPYLQETP